MCELNQGSDPDPANDGENLTVIPKWVKNTTPYLGLIETSWASLLNCGESTAGISTTLEWNDMKGISYWLLATVMLSMLTGCVTEVREYRTRIAKTKIHTESTDDSGFNFRKIGRAHV